MRLSSAVWMLLVRSGSPGQAVSLHWAQRPFLPSEFLPGWRLSVYDSAAPLRGGERERARESERFKRVQESIAMQRLVICSSRISYLGGACAHFAKRVPRVVNLVRSQHGVGRTAYAVGQGHCTWALSCVGH